MSQFKYIKIAVTGQWEGELKRLYTYPSDGEQQWPYELADPETVIRNFLNARDCYLLQRGPQGHCFSMVTRNPLEARAGYMMISLLLADGYSLTGRQIVTTMASLRKTLLEDADRFDDAVTRCLEDVGLPRQGVQLPSWKYQQPVSKAVSPAGTAYRTYVSGSDLDNILSFPDQLDYQRFASVIAIAATASMRPGVRLERITQPVKKVYSVICPEGVTASKSVIAEGERLGLTFTKDNFSPRKETVLAGAPSPYVRYEGSAIRVKTPRESGLGFVRRVRIDVRSAKGGTVSGYTINVNGRPVNTMEPYIELNENELADGRVTEINVASTNYRPLKVSKESAEIAALDTLELVLEPMEQGIILRLDFGEGRVFEQTISIEKNTPEYSQLHSGNFHGFRAHRVTSQGAGEIYNVDVRSGIKPQAPSFANVASTTGTKPAARRAPVFENVSDRAGSGSGYRRVNITNGTRGADATAERNGREEDDNDADSRRERRDHREPGRPSGRKLGYIVGAVLALLVLILAFVFILPGGSKADDDMAANDSTFSADQDALVQTIEPQSSEPAAAAPAATETPAASSATDEAADIKYLNDNDKSWDLSQLKSPKYKALADALRAGDINALASNEYFAASQCSGKYAREIVTWAWESQGSPQEGKNREALRDAVKGDKVNLFELWDKISRYKPSEKYSQPLPSK